MVKRLLTAVVGISAGVVIVYFLNSTLIYLLAVCAIAGMSVHELLTATKTGFKYFPVHYIFCLIFAVMLPALAWFEVSEIWRLFAAGVIGFLMFAGFVADNKKLSYNRLAMMCLCTILVTFPITCLVSLIKMSDIHGPVYVTMALMAAWLPDAGAFFVGSAIGKHKLCPNISPKKTIEGAVGGVIVSAIVFVIFAYIYRAIMAARGINFNVGLPILIPMAVVAAVISIFGDLTASLIKREYEIKDFGNVFPGHGGFVDRFDSVYFVLPFIMFILNAFGDGLFIMN